MKYLPFLLGKYSTAPGLLPLTKAEDAFDQLIFQIDENYEAYLENKKRCRQENIRKYYAEASYDPATAARVNEYLVRQLLAEYPETFFYSQDQDRHQLSNRRTGGILTWGPDWRQSPSGPYLSLFDALCSQIQEDVAVCQLDGETDWLAALHLSAPNHWAAGDKIGKPFDAVHGEVPDMEKTLSNYFKMLDLLVRKGPFTRFAWGIATDDRLNHHPVPPPGRSPEAWQGRKLENDTPEIFVRVERQNLVGFPEANAFLFTIRTFFYPVSTLLPEEKQALFRAVISMSPRALAYKGLTGQVEILRQWLEREEVISEK